MAFKLIRSARTEIVIPLACDPDTQEANTPEALADWVYNGMDSDLTVPKSATKALIRPLTYEQRAAIQDGQQAHLYSSRGLELYKASIESEVAGTGDEFRSGLTPEDSKALQNLTLLVRHRDRAYARAGTVEIRHPGMDPMPLDRFLDLCPDDVLADRALIELAQHIRRISGLDGGQGKS